jgi:hypothetical protein
VAPSNPDLVEPNGPRRGGCNLFLIAVLLLLVAVLAYWGYEASETGAPTPAATGVPPTPPTGAGAR